MLENKSFTFPFAIDAAGVIGGTNVQDAIKGKIIQVLFSAPGERVNLPEFGCGLFNLVFEPNNDILAAAMEFTVAQALARWLADEIMVDLVTVESIEEAVFIEIAYTRRIDLSKEAVRIQFK